MDRKYAIQCAVRGCTTKRGRSKNVPIHRFPKRGNAGQLWIQACANSDLSGLEYLQLVERKYFVCHQHFDEKDYYQKRNGAYLLKSGAVPTLHLPPDSGTLCESDVNINLPTEESEVYEIDIKPEVVSFPSGYKISMQGLGKSGGGMRDVRESNVQFAHLYKNNMTTSKTFDSTEHQHIRYNPLKGEWVLVSPHRMNRPWGGQVEPSNDENVPEYDENNPLCPGSTRANGQVTPKYKKTFSFNNDFPALLEDVPSPPPSEDELFLMDSAKGRCKVMCFHPKSNVTIALMKHDEIVEVIMQWINEMLDLGKKWAWVQIFENRGALMGCSNAHPHCQIWASSFIPTEAKVKDRLLCDFYRRKGIPLLIDYVQKEIIKKERIVIENREWLVVVPFWAIWPYETMVLPKKQVQRMQDLTRDQQELLAVTMKKLCTKYDNLFSCSFPYSMGWHGAPTGQHLNEDCSYWTFHGIYLPPLLRSATIKKHMVGYELLAQAQRDLTPEQAADKLRSLSDIHYKHPEKSIYPD